MKRYASHFLFLPEYGYLKQSVVETQNGVAVCIFPLTEEIEDVEWLPGAIALLPNPENSTIKELLQSFSGNLLKTCPSSFNWNSRVVPIYFPCFDIKTMQPVSGTRHKQLP